MSAGMPEAGERIELSQEGNLRATFWFIRPCPKRGSQTRNASLDFESVLLEG